MTELEKKAEEYAIKKSCKRCNKLVCDYPSEYCKWYKSVFEIAKENEELKKAVTEKNSEVEKLKDGSLLKELTERVKQQAAQIEKMKCCFNCKYGNGSAYNFECIGCLWELAE